MCSARKNLAPYGTEEKELPLDGHKLEAAGALYIPLTEYKWLNSVTHSPLSIDTPAHKKNLPVECRFEDALTRERSEAAEGEKMEEALSESEEEMDTAAPVVTARAKPLAQVPRESLCRT